MLVPLVSSVSVLSLRAVSWDLLLGDDKTSTRQAQDKTVALPRFVLIWWRKHHAHFR